MVSQINWLKGLYLMPALFHVVTVIGNYTTVFLYTEELVKMAISKNVFAYFLQLPCKVDVRQIIYMPFHFTEVDLMHQSIRSEQIVPRDTHDLITVY